MDDMNELNDTIASGKKDIEEMRERLSRLRNLSDDDRSEAGQLKSRIEEQSHLIMVLKKRADEHLIRAQTVEKLNEELQERNDKLQRNDEKQNKKLEILDAELSRSVSSYRVLAQSADQLKNETDRLKQENEDLRARMARHLSRQATQRDEEMDKLRESFLSLEREKKDLEQQLMAALKKASAEEVLRKQMDDMKHKLTSQEALIQQLQLSRQGETDLLASETYQKWLRAKEENNQLKEEIQTLKQLLKENDRDSDTMRSKLMENEKLIKDLRVNQEKYTANAGGSQQMQKLREELRTKSTDFNELVREYRAYKTHADKLLQSEREVNARLRSLYS